MMSLREQIMQAVIAKLAAVGLPGGGFMPVYRISEDPIRRGERMAYIADWVQESVETLTYDRDECALQLRISVLVRSTERDDAQADELMIAAHSAVMADRSLGGLCAAVHRRAAARTADYAEASIITLVHLYAVSYRHKAVDLTAA